MKYIIEVSSEDWWKAERDVLRKLSVNAIPVIDLEAAVTHKDGKGCENMRIYVDAGEQ